MTITLSHLAATTDCELTRGLINSIYGESPLLAAHDPVVVPEARPWTQVTQHFYCRADESGELDREKLAIDISGAARAMGRAIEDRILRYPGKSRVVVVAPPAPGVTEETIIIGGVFTLLAGRKYPSPFWRLMVPGGEHYCCHLSLYLTGISNTKLGGDTQ